MFFFVYWVWFVKFRWFERYSDQGEPYADFPNIKWLLREWMKPQCCQSRNSNCQINTEILKFSLSLSGPSTHLLPVLESQQSPLKIHLILQAILDQYIMKRGQSSRRWIKAEKFINWLNLDSQKGDILPLFQRVRVIGIKIFLLLKMHTYWGRGNWECAMILIAELAQYTTERLHHREHHQQVNTR